MNITSYQEKIQRIPEYETAFEEGPHRCPFCGDIRRVFAYQGELYIRGCIDRGQCGAETDLSLPELVEWSVTPLAYSAGETLWMLRNFGAWLRMDAQGLLWTKIPDVIDRSSVTESPADLEPSAELVAGTLQPLAVVWNVLLARLSLE